MEINQIQVSLTNHCFKSDRAHYIIVESNLAVFSAITMNQYIKNVIVQTVSRAI